MPEARQNIAVPTHLLVTDGTLAGSNIGYSSLAQLASVLPNNLRINGVEHFYQTTKPTTRGDNSALVVGDRWYKTDDQTEWQWNGTYWLSPVYLSSTYSTGSFQSAVSETNVLIPTPDNNFRPIFVHFFNFTTRPGATIDASNNWLIRLFTGNGSNPWATALGSGVNIFPLAVAGNWGVREVLNTALSINTSSPSIFIEGFALRATRTGSPTSIFQFGLTIGWSFYQ